jgi:hypothetical protein
MFGFQGGESAATGACKKEPVISSETAEEMANYGITRVPVDYFYYGDFRYTYLKDAVAQAKRQQRKQKCPS